MSELADEVEAIDAIYPECAEVLADGILALKVPSHQEITIQLAFPLEYPEEKPSVLQVVTTSRRYPDPLYLERTATQILESVYVQGDVVIFEFIGELEMFFEEYEKEHEEERKREEEKKMNELKKRVAELEMVSGPSQLSEGVDGATDGVNGAYIKVSNVAKLDKNLQLRNPLDLQAKDYTAGWVRSEPVIDRGSTFIAFARAVHSVEEAKELLFDLTCDRKISRSTHNMNTWRIKGDNGVTFQDCDDDGETAAGLRMLHLLTIMDAWNVIVVVSRWFGGIHLGPDRFKHINSATRDVLIRGGFYTEQKKRK